MKKKSKKTPKKRTSKKKTSVKKRSKVRARRRKKIKKGKAAKSRPSKKKTVQAVEGKYLGRVIHYFPHVNAAAIKIEKGKLAVGDQLYFKGHTTDFRQIVESLQINHVMVSKVRVGDDVGIRVRERVREHDAVYKI
ncbi:MAG TPA: hypothetical protein VD913_02315 [bacterium]|nr:hypothetical protein [bacterium]